MKVLQERRSVINELIKMNEIDVNVDGESGVFKIKVLQN